MICINDDQVIMFDVDDTLLKWDDKYFEPGIGKMAITCPHTSDVLYLTPMKRHIDLLRQHKGRGFTVIVWSAAGYEWARTAVKALELEDHVDFTMSKPLKFVDDLPAHEILGKRIYLYEEKT